jgi:arylsulfatase A-like enzyme
LVLPGCAGEPGASGGNEPSHVAAAQAVGPDTLVIEGAPIAGRTITFRLSGLDPNTDVRLFGTGQPGNGSICGQLVCLDLAAPAKLKALATADANGDVSLPVALPVEAAGVTASYQAVRVVGGVTGTSAVRTVSVVGEQNVLVILIDDLGVDQLGLMGLGSEIAPTPRIDTLAAEGILFTHAYAQPLCSPTRAALLTGRYGWRTGVTDGLAADDDFALSQDEILIPEMLDAGAGTPYENGYAGKWHLGTLLDSMLDHPIVHGFSYYAGSLQGVAPSSYTSDGLTQTNYDWERIENGVAARSTAYLDSDQTDAAIARVDAMAEPWFMMVATSNPHYPLHDPPAELYSGPEVGDDLEDHQFHWMIEAMDTEIGRLLDSIDADVLSRTTVILLSDNGTKGERVAPDLDEDRQKKSLYEGGVRVPMVVWGPLVSTPGRVVDHVVDATDVFPTVAEIAGATLDPTIEIDGVSLLPYLVEPETGPLRGWVYAEITDKPGDAYTTRDEMVRDARYKLVRVDGIDELYDLEGRAWEGPDLLADGTDDAEAAIVDSLTAVLPVL